MPALSRTGYDPASGFVVHLRLAGGAWSTLPIPLTPTDGPVSSTKYASKSQVNRTSLFGEHRPKPMLTAYVPPQPVIGDYDGDGRSDAAVFVPGSGMWNVQGSKAGLMTRQWGATGDIPVPADYDADGRDDFAVWRPSTGEWHILHASGQQRIQKWGTNGDVPVPAR